MSETGIRSARPLTSTYQRRAYGQLGHSPLYVRDQHMVS